MAFIYDARFTVRSVIDNLDDAGLPTGEPEISITTHDGFLKVEPTDSGDILSLSYSESVEGDRIFTDIRVADGCVSLSRKGAAEYDIRFAEGEEYKGLYTVPPYKFDMRVTTKRLRLGMTRGGGEIRINYSMTVGGAEKSCRMCITLEVK